MPQSDRPVLTFAAAMELVAEAARLRGVDPTRVARRERTQSISYTRFGVVWVMRQLGYPYKSIAKALNFKDHTSVIHAERRAIEFRVFQPSFTTFTDDLLSFGMDLDGPKLRVANG